MGDTLRRGILLPNVHDNIKRVNASSHKLTSDLWLMSTHATQKDSDIQKLKDKRYNLYFDISTR